MAAPTHSPSRRALLGAAVALPLMGRAGAAVATPTAAKGWCRALAAYEGAEAELRAFERLTAGAPWVEQPAIEDGYGERLDALYAALRRLLRVPAPDLPALAVKIALTVDHEVGTLTGGEACMATLKRDARRLAKSDSRERRREGLLPQGANQAPPVPEGDSHCAPRRRLSVIPA